MERLRLLAARTALVATTVAMVLGTGLQSAQAAAITTKNDIISNDMVSATSVSHSISFVAVGSTATCVKLTFDGSTAVSAAVGSDVWADYSNESGQTQVATSSIDVATPQVIKVITNNPIQAAMSNADPKIITIIVRAITNGGTAGAGSVAIATYSDGATCIAAVDTGSVSYTLVNDRVTQNVGVKKALSWKIDGTTTHEYRVDPTTNFTDTNSNTIGVTTNADSYAVYINNTQAPTRVDGTGTNSGFNSTATSGTLANTMTGSHAVPLAFGASNSATAAGETGFGYNVGTVTGSTVDFAGATLYSVFDIAATHDTTTTALAKGSPTGVSSNTTTAAGAANHAIVTYKVAVNYSVTAGYYRTVTVYTVTPTYN